VNSAILMFNRDGRLTNLYRENLLLAISATDEKSVHGFEYYNLANSYRSTHDLYLASKYYQLARKNDPRYLKKAYWWSDFAGVFFLSSHYRCAEKCYRKSIELDPDYHVPLNYSLLGDALFFQGKFSDAQSEFDRFLNVQSAFPTEEIFLKRQICENFILAGLDNVRFDIARSMALTEEAIASKDFEKLNEAIAAYPLNALAWFDYGVFLKDDGKKNDALTAFLSAACIQDWDREAWKNCFFISLNQRNMEVAGLVYTVMIDKFGDEVVNYMAQDVLNDPKLPKEAKILLVEAMGKLKANC
jgi:tetratricopeptide (TPR) repeat protein